jgi:hypothetical protein
VSLEQRNGKEENKAIWPRNCKVNIGRKYCLLWAGSNVQVERQCEASVSS